MSGESNAGAYSPLHSEPSLRHSISQNGHHEDSLDLAQPASNAAPSVQTPFMGSSARGNSRCVGLLPFLVAFAPWCHSPPCSGLSSPHLTRSNPRELPVLILA